MTHIIAMLATAIVVYAAITYVERKLNVATDIARDLNVK